MILALGQNLYHFVVRICIVTMVDSSIFLDTNILVYAAVNSSPFHRSASDYVERCQQLGGQLWISRQIIREYMAVLSRPQVYTHPLSVAALTKDTDYFIS